MKTNIKNHLTEIWDELTYGLRWLCLRPSPAKRLAAILILIFVLSGLNIWFVASSVYNIGKRDARRELLQIEHIRQPELQQKNDSINQLKKQLYE
jgi:hypothetical protein